MPVKGQKKRRPARILLFLVAPVTGLLALLALGVPPAAASVTIHYSPACGCCGEYAKYLDGQGFDVRTVSTEEMDGVKNSLGVPAQVWSCHTTRVERYFIEGHVPVEVIQKLMTEKPDIDGISLPGMPAGSPGMPGIKGEAFTIYSVSQGRTAVFATV